MAKGKKRRKVRFGRGKKSKSGFSDVPKRMRVSSSIKPVNRSVKRQARVQFVMSFTNAATPITVTAAELAAAVTATNGDTVGMAYIIDASATINRAVSGGFVSLKDVSSDFTVSDTGSTARAAACGMTWRDCYRPRFDNNATGAVIRVVARSEDSAADQTFYVTVQVTLAYWNSSMTAGEIITHQSLKDTVLRVD